jgi:cytochrome c oxidase subunit 2
VSATLEQPGPRHGFRIVVIWAVLSVVAVPLVVFVLGPHLPPGRMTNASGAQTDANTVMTALLTPIVLLILVFFGYTVATFRHRGELIEDGPPLRGDAPTQTTWLLATSAIVLALAVYGSYTLVESTHGAGGGQGPSPSATPSGHQNALQIQVIAQQWEWTFRFPGYGAFETRELELPVNQLVEFHVTSIDITHSFWAYGLGVKADAVPGVDNIAYVTPHKTGKFTVRCAELCGLWHGHMYRTGYVVNKPSFDTWVSQQRSADAGNLKYLPPYSRTYFPEPQHRAG